MLCELTARPQSIKSLTEELEQQLSMGAYFALAYVDDDGDEVIVPELDDAACDEIRRFARQIIVIKS